jgi:DNA polymerase-3 subunit beta
MRTNAALLRAGLAVLKKLVLHRPALPVLEQVKLEVKDGQLLVEGTDLDTRVRFTMPAVDALPALLIPFRRFAALLEAAGGKKGDVALTVEGRRAKAEVNGRTFFLDTPIPAEEFPAPLPEPKTPHSATYDVPEDLAAALDWLLPAVGYDSTRPMLTGLCFDGAALIACDGHRLHLVNGMPELPGRALLPNTAVRTLLAFMKGFKPDAIHGSVGDGTFQFKATAQGVTFSMTSKAVEGEYPDYLEIIPQLDSTTARVPVAQFDAALALAAKVADRGNAKVQLNGALIIQADDPEDGGSICEHVEAVRISGDADIEAGFNLGYLRDAISVEGESVVLGMTDERSPMTIRPEDQRRLAVVMPMRL